jgi:hypothetical protein
VRLEEYETARVNAEKIFASAVDKDLQTKSHALVLSLRRIQEQLKWISQNPGIGNPPQIPMEEALLMSLNEALRKPQKDEKRVLGNLTQIECGEKDVNLVVRSEEPNSKSVVKFSVADLQKIRMTAFVPDFAGNEVTCGARNPEDFVVVTYRKADAASTETLGEVVALEFVPKIFRFKP